MTQYYFLATALPPIHFDAPPELTFAEFDTLLKENLSPHDMQAVSVLRRYYDILNIREFWKGRAFDHYGTLNEKELEEALLGHIFLPEFVGKFLDKYTSKKERLEHFSELIGDYFRFAGNYDQPFVKEYLKFERDLRLVLVALRCKILKQDVLKELQFEDPTDLIVAQILAQKDAPEYEPPAHFQTIKQIFIEYPEKPFKLHQALNRYRYDMVENMVGVHLFSFDTILGYMIRLIMVLKSLELDEKKGIERVDEMIEERA